MGTGALQTSYHWSLREPASFWGEAAEAVHWYKKWDKVLDDSRQPFYRWFVGGQVNTCYNALDLHVDEGHGDHSALIMGVTAPWVAARVAADDRFQFGTVFLLWNLFGIADFLDAVLLGTIYNTGLMQRLPLVLIPCFFVPLLFLVHITLLEQRRK